MSIVAVLGAGTLGGSIAHKIAARGRFNEVRLIDPAQGVAGGKALDIQQSGAIERFGTRVTAHGDLDAAVGADAVVLADAAGSVDAAHGADGGEQALETLRRLYRFNRRAFIICAGVPHRRVVERAVAELAISRRQVIGAAPAALQSALRAIVAVELRCPPGDVSLAVLGRPPEHLVIPWSEATVRGYALSRLLDAPTLAPRSVYARLGHRTAVRDGNRPGRAEGTGVLHRPGRRTGRAQLRGRRHRGTGCRRRDADRRTDAERAGAGATGDGARLRVAAAAADPQAVLPWRLIPSRSRPAAPAASRGPGAGVT